MGCVFRPPDFIPIIVAVAQLPNRWVIATIGVTRAVVSTSVATANPEGKPKGERIRAIMGATEAAGPMAAIPINADDIETCNN
jgi:hypothetical protein